MNSKFPVHFMPLDIQDKDFDYKSLAQTLSGTQSRYKKGDTIKLRLLANSAAPSPVLGQALGQYGINIMNFCKKFNQQTQNLKQGILVPTRVTVYSQTSFEIEIKTPSTVSLLKKIAELRGLGRGETPIPLQDIYHIALFKKSESKLSNLKTKSLCKSLRGTVLSMGFSLVA
jgi:large subunit ribosomal protein L11